MIKAWFRPASLSLLATKNIQQKVAKKFQLRGIPTSIIINKDGLEFARIIGSIDFEDEKFIDWLSNYN